MRPHRLQPARLSPPWDSPGENTGVGCHFLLQCVKVKSERQVAQSCQTLSEPMDCSPPGSSVHEIFQARVLEWGALPSLKLLLRPCWMLTKTRTQLSLKNTLFCVIQYCWPTFAFSMNYGEGERLHFHMLFLKIAVIRLLSEVYFLSVEVLVVVQRCMYHMVCKRIALANIVLTTQGWIANI